MILGDMLPCRALKVVTERLNVRVQTHATKKASITKFRGDFKRRASFKKIVKFLGGEPSKSSFFQKFGTLHIDDAKNRDAARL